MRIRDVTKLPDTEEAYLVRHITRLGLKQREIADRLGVTQAVVSMWAAGRRKPGWARMDMLRELDSELTEQRYGKIWDAYGWR